MISLDIYLLFKYLYQKAGNNEENLVKMQRHTSSSKNQYEQQQQQRQPPPIPPHPNNSSNQVVGYPFFGSGNGSGGFNSGSGSSGTAPSIPQQSSGSDSGRARVRRGEHNSECVLYDPAESVVVSF